MDIKELGVRLKPSVPKRHLLIVAAFIWFFAGSMLAYRGILGLHETGWKSRGICIALTGGVLLFWLLFIKISSGHIRRINSLEILKPCVFSFFNFKSYFLMALMITMGISIRRLHLVGTKSLSYFFIFMATPLLLSALLFFRAWNKYSSIIHSEN